MKRYMLIEYHPDFENILKDKLQEEGITTYFDDPDLTRVIASAYMFLRFREVKKNNFTKLCRNCEENEAIDGNYCSEDCAEDSFYNCAESQATRN